jgi:uncharacterized protein YaaR (DUF327 family)
MKVNSLTDYGLPKDILPKAEHGNRAFSKYYQTASKNLLKHNVDQEMQVISEIGRRLSKRKSLADLREFKQKVAEFLKMCISEGLSFKEERFPAHYGQSKVLTIIKKVNEKLLELAETVISENSDSLKIAALVDEIRGLLLDIYV